MFCMSVLIVWVGACLRALLPFFHYHLGRCLFPALRYVLCVGPYCFGRCLSTGVTAFFLFWSLPLLAVLVFSARMFCVSVLTVWGGAYLRALQPFLSFFGHYRWGRCLLPALRYVLCVGPYCLGRCLSTGVTAFFLFSVITVVGGTCFQR